MRSVATDLEPQQPYLDESVSDLAVSADVDTVPDEAATGEEETAEIFSVRCPDCRQPIALLADEEVLPEHARCATRWNPFGLSVCRGSGRLVEDATRFTDRMDPQNGEGAVLLTLPEGLNWRTQPFSHVGGPGSQPMRMRRQAC